jgi:hypothetical protein
MLSVRFDRASPTFSALEKTCKLEDIAGAILWLVEAQGW